MWVQMARWRGYWVAGSCGQAEDITGQFLAPSLGGSLITTHRVHNLGLWSLGECHSGTKEAEQGQGWHHPALSGEEQGHALATAAMS